MAQHSTNFRPFGQLHYIQTFQAIDTIVQRTLRWFSTNYSSTVGWMTYMSWEKVFKLNYITCTLAKGLMNIIHNL